MIQGGLNKKSWWCVALMLAMISSSSNVSADITPEKVKASFILQMPKFVSVGEPPRKVKQICYYEKPGVSIEESTGQLLAQYVNSHPNSGLSVKRYEAVRDFAGCDLFFIPSHEEANLDNILTVLGTSSTLTISAAKRFIYRGGMIGFVMDDENHIRMEANLKNIRGKNILIDAQLLEIMQQVIN